MENNNSREITLKGMENNNSREITLTGMENNNFIIELFSQEIACMDFGLKKPLNLMKPGSTHG